MEYNLIAIGLYSVAALAGLIMAVRIFQSKPSPALLAVLHLLFAGAGSATLFLFITGGQGVNTLFKVALGLYVLAALGGLYLGSFRFGTKYPPKAIVAIHALIAVAGTTTLLYASFG